MHHRGLAALRHRDVPEPAQGGAIPAIASTSPCSGSIPPASTTRRARTCSATRRASTATPQAMSVWQEMQAAAEEAYDRSDACSFTSFIGYEHTNSPLGRHLHRNVIFRNHVVPDFAASQLETASGGSPQGVWSAIEQRLPRPRQRLRRGHHPAQLEPERWASVRGSARRRRRAAPPGPRAAGRDPPGEGQLGVPLRPPGGRRASAPRTSCAAYEQLRVDRTRGRTTTRRRASRDWPRRNLVRNALEDGLALEERLGANPFRMGFVGGTDAHDGDAGQHRGARTGRARRATATRVRQRRIARELRTNPGGLAGVWAEENSRDAIFAALERRETYATSGTRPLVRLFAGALDGVTCDAPDLVARAYATGTPMGGELGAVRGGASPRFAVLAVKDPGTAEVPGTDLQRVQIVKGWVDASGATHERVYDVAGSAADGIGLDHASCTPRRGCARAVRGLGGSRVRSRPARVLLRARCSRTRAAAGAPSPARPRASIRSPRTARRRRRWPARRSPTAA